jgi:3',5'-cyclic AMP phosphodiesterase CpdA
VWHENAGTSALIVHLSDVHFGTTHRFANSVTPDGDTVVDGPGLLDSIAADVTSRLDATVEGLCPILICITGDLTETASVDEFDEAATFVRGLEKRLSALGARVVLTPGNHDVLWTNNSPAKRLLHWRAFLRDDLRIDGVGLDGQEYAKVHTEFLESHGVIVAAINSAAFVQKDTPETHRGRLSDEGLKQLEAQLSTLESDVFRSSIRVAIVHHHPILIPDLAEPRRRYDAIVDGGFLMKVLRAHRFHLVLHGHKHLPYHFSEDSHAAYSTVEPREQRPIFVVCGGSVGSKELSDRMAAPTNFYNLIWVKWLPSSQECRTRVEPRFLVRHRANMELPEHQWYWRQGVADDRCHSPSGPPAGRAGGGEEHFDWDRAGLSDHDRQVEYERLRGVFAVVKICPSLLPGQAHEAQVWVEHHPGPQGSPRPETLRRVTWSAGRRHSVVRVSDDATGRFEARFAYYGAMLVRAQLEFTDGTEATQFIYVRLEQG